MHRPRRAVGVGKHCHLMLGDQTRKEDKRMPDVNIAYFIRASLGVGKRKDPPCQCPALGLRSQTYGHEKTEY